jgi:hypothetical protein
LTNFRFPAISRNDLASCSPEPKTRRKRGVFSNLPQHGSWACASVALAVLFGLIAFATLAFPTSGVEAKDVSQATYQGLILQVDSTNRKDVTFSLLDRRGVSHTFHLLATTQFKTRQSAAHLKVNVFVTVVGKSATEGELDALSIRVQGPNRATLSLQGVVASITQSQQTMNLALNDGTVLDISMPRASMAHLQTGQSLAVKANFAADGSLVASTYRVIASHASHFQARGIISYVDMRLHVLTLVSPSGTAFSVLQKQNNGAHSTGSLRVGEKVMIAGNIDKGQLNGQSFSVENASEQQFTVIGMVSAIDTNGGTFSLVDEEGNVSTLNASADLLSSIVVGGIYEIEISIGSDGSLTALQILATEGNDQGGTLSLQGTVQFYDANSGLLNVSTDGGQPFTLLTNSQTQIVNSDGSSASLTRGEAITALVQIHADGTYNVLRVVVEDGSSSGDEITFVGFFNSYDDASGLLTITIGQGQLLSFATDGDTSLEGAPSFDAINVGSLIKLKAQVQSDGSYLALEVKVPDNGGSNGDDGHHLPSKRVAHQ